MVSLTLAAANAQTAPTPSRVPGLEVSALGSIEYLADGSCKEIYMPRWLMALAKTPYY